MKQFKIKIKAVVKYNDNYLIVKKWYNDRIVTPYQWEFLDGELSFGENPEMAAERIVREQTQLEVAEGELLYTWSYVVGDICYVGIAIGFECQNPVVIMSEESLEYYWATAQELDDSEHPMNDNVLKDVLKAY